MTGLLQRMERHQVVLYLAAIVVGALGGTAVPAVAPGLTLLITPVLGLLLFATFLGVPLTRLGQAFRDLRFLGVLLAVNFLAVPVLVFGLTRFIADDRALLLGVLLVLLTPCVDYVIVFAGLAGGARDRLLAATPLLMLLQILLLPVYLRVLAGPAAVQAIEVGPFLEAFLLLIVLPLAAAAIVQWAAPRWRAGRVVETGMAALMVPLMMATLAIVVGSQIARVGAEAAVLLRLVPIFVLFLVIMVGVGLLLARAGRLDVPAARAVVFSGVTRNSLVVLPLALALSPDLALAPLAVVTQTLVELIGMVILVRLVPRLLPRRAPVGVSSSDAAGRPG